MEDYLTMEEFDKLNKPIEERKNKKNELTPFMKFGHASFIVGKAIWWVITGTLKGIYNALLKVNEALDKARESKTGKAMMEKYKKENRGFSFGMPPQQKGKKAKHQNPFGWG